MVLRQVKEAILRAVLSVTRFRPPLREQCKQFPVKHHPCHTPANGILNNKYYSRISYFQKSVRNKFLFRRHAKQTWNNRPQIFFKCHTYQNHCKGNTINQILKMSHIQTSARGTVATGPLQMPPVPNNAVTIKKKKNLFKCHSLQPSVWGTVATGPLQVRPIPNRQ